MRLQRIGIAASTLPLVAARGGRNDVDVESIIGFVLVGIVVGLLARFLVPGRDPIGIIGTIVLGVIGAVAGGWLAGAVFAETQGVDWIASILVAIVLVLLARAASGRRRLV